MHDLDSEDSEPSKSDGSPRKASRLFSVVALVIALMEVGLAFAAHLFSQQGYCPVELGHGSACAPLIRPRLAALGPISVSQAALVYSVLSMGLCGALASGLMPHRIKRLSAILLSAGAAFGVGIQALPLALGAAACLLCTGVATAVTAVAGFFWLAARDSVNGRVPLIAFSLVLLAVTPLAALRGQAIKAEDEQRRGQVSEVGGADGPQIILVSRPGCPYCEALLLDVLGDPTILDQLAMSRGVITAREYAPEVRVHLKVPRVPTLLAVSADGKQIGEPLLGLQPLEIVDAWLRSVLASRTE
jgi:hypothetical protein